MTYKKINKHDVWIIIPAYNEAPAIGSVIRHVQQHGFNNILVINDGSSDDTAAIALRNGAEVITHIINRGAGAVAQTGIEFARRHKIEYIIQIDADGQHHAEDLLRFVQRMEHGGCDIIIGSRFAEYRKAIPPIRRFYNFISNILTNWFCQNWYSDSQSGFRMLNSRAIHKLDLRLDGFGYCSEMIIQAERLGLKIIEIPISVSYTEYSLSKGQNFAVGILTAFNLLWKLIFHSKH